MDQNVEDINLIRKYLLGELDDDQRQELEERMMSDSELFERTLAAEDDLVDEYVEGSLSDRERERLEASWLSTTEGHRQVSFARALRKAVLDEDPVPKRRWWEEVLALPYLKPVAVAMLCLVVGAGIWTLSHESDVTKGMAALAAAYRERRPLEARISGFRYAPVSETRNGQQETVDLVSRDRAERILLDAVFEDPGPDSHHALGRLYLAQHKFDLALTQLDEALKANPNDARLQADYGAALLENGKAVLATGRDGTSLEEFARSLEHLNKALELDESLLEARFNRALLYQHMGLPQQAEDEWKKYLDRDSASPWADEARQNLVQLEQRKLRGSQSKEQYFKDFLDAHTARDDEASWNALKRSRFRDGNFIVDQLQQRYLRLAEDGQHHEARNTVQTLSYAGRLELERAGDRYTSDLAQFYERSKRNQLPLIAQARSLLVSGQEQARNAKYEDAINLFADAREIFNRIGNACEANYVEYKLGQCYLRQTEMAKCLAIFERLAEICEKNNHRWMLARIYNALSDAHDSLNEYSKALHFSRLSIEKSEQIDDLTGAVRGFLQTASEYHSVGDYGKSLGFIERGLAVADVNPLDPVQLWIIHDVAAEAFASLGLYGAAIVYQKEALQLAKDLGAPLNLSRCYAHLGRIYGKLKDYDQALGSARQALTIGETLADQRIGLDLMASSFLQLGHLYREAGDFGNAIASYDRNISIFEDLNFHAESYQAHKGKLLCYIAQGDDSSSARELKVALGLIDQYRYRILEDSNKNSFFDSEQDLYDLAIDFEYSRMKNPRAAFEHSEASRARSLLDMDHPDTKLFKHAYGLDLQLAAVSHPLKLAEIQQQLPNQVQILQYAALGDKLLIWIVTRTSFFWAEAKVALTDLNERVETYLRLVLSPSDSREEEQLRNARELYDLLVQPIEPFIDRSKYVCIVPDKILNYLPFAALASASHKYFADECLMGFAPSSTVFLKSSVIARNKGGEKSESLLSAGNPRFDREEFPALGPLESSRHEATDIASLYEPGLSLIEENATESRVKTAILQSDVVHLATHYVVDERSPLLSRLVLAPEPPPAVANADSDGSLQAYEIYGMKLPRTRLAVLSACQTGIERVSESEGAIGVARPFIKAGVPLVIASLWPVDSDSTSELMIRFHRNRKKHGMSSVEALREAQREMLNSPNPRYRQPYYWAPFIAIGGYAEF